MVLIAGLIGIGLALEAVERRHANRDALARKNNFQDEQDVQRDSQDVSQITQTHQDEAFQEVQNYADFQKKLSEKVDDDLMNEASFTTQKYASESPNVFKRSLSQPQYLNSTILPPVPQTGLPSPVVIPQQRSEDGRMMWVRAYAPVLWQCGITQDSLFHFIDCYNETTKSCPRSEVINILAMGVGHYSSMAQLLSSKAIPMAVDLSKGSQSLEPTSTYLRQANNQLFAPHGLYAMVITLSHRESQIYTVDGSQSFSSTLARAPEQQFMFTDENESSQASLTRARGNKGDTKKQLRRPNSKKKAGHKSDGLLKTAFKGAFPSRAQGRKTGVNNLTTGTRSRPGEGSTMIQPIETREMEQDALYLLIVNDTPDAFAFMPANQDIQPQFHNHSYSHKYNGRPSLQVDIPNQPWVYDPGNKDYSSGTFDTSFSQQHNDPPPAYNSMVGASHDREYTDEGDYCVPTL